LVQRQTIILSPSLDHTILLLWLAKSICPCLKPKQYLSASVLSALANGGNRLGLDSLLHAQSHNNIHTHTASQHNGGSVMEVFVGGAQDKSIDSWSTTVSYTLTVTIRVSAIGTSSKFWANTSSLPTGLEPSGHIA
jgi:hypothetical protein